MDLDRLRTFAAVVEHRSFSRAARALGRTQSTVSFHVRALEEEAGAQLVDRRRGGARPTPAGKALLPYARRLASIADEALRRVRDEDRGERGTLRVAASSIPGEILLPPMIARFRAAHPGVRVVLDVSHSRRALEALLADEADVAVTGARPSDRRLSLALFAEDEVVVVGAPDRAFARGRRPPLAELAAAPWLAREEGSATRAAARALAAGLPEPSVIASSTEALKRLALAGAGLAPTSRLAVTDELARGALELVAAPGAPVRRRFYAARLRAATPTPAARSFFSMLRIH
jgi:DNA-binding transcriptional LysR family regulator